MKRIFHIKVDRAKIFDQLIAGFNKLDIVPSTSRNWNAGLTASKSGSRASGEVFEIYASCDSNDEGAIKKIIELIGGHEYHVEESSF